MASIRQIKSGKWQVRWADVDGEDRSRTCPTKKAAEELRREVEHAISLGRRWEPAAARAVTSADDAMTAYIGEMAIGLAPKTVERYSYALRLFGRFLDDTGHAALHIGELSRPLLVEFYGWLTKPETGRHGHQREPSSRAKIVQAVQLWWEWLAEESEWADDVPPARRLKKMARDTEADLTFKPTWDEMDACIAHAYGWRKQLAMVLRFTGLRPFQVMLARAVDIDLKQGLFLIRHGKSTQEARGRIVPISEHLRAEIEHWDLTGEWLIETGLETARVRQSRGLEMAECWQRAGVREEVWKDNPHRAFRAGFQSGLKAAGADDEAVKYLVGHDLGLRRHYLDPTSLPVKEAVALIPPLKGSAQPKKLKRRAL